MAENDKFRHIERVSQERNLPTELLTKIFEVESDFHSKIIIESSFDKRQDLYNEFYKNIYKLGFPTFDKIAQFKHEVKAKSSLVAVFKPELEGKSIIDVGCGSGCFLYALKQSGLPHGQLYGVDAKKPSIVKDEISNGIDFEEVNVIKFETTQSFDVAISDNVFEHIAPADKHFYLESIKKTLNPAGTLILLIPHKGFGPSDYTMIKDNTRSGKIVAECAHLNETTFSEVIADLTEQGFTSFKSPLPFVALSPLRKIFPSLRLNSKVFASLEKNYLFNNFLKKIKINGRSLFRMEVIIIAKF
jgi:2-polyprenyl-3-methyl-5-hydroxy-6-metoxy-1,4-benzoquinol methylase